MYDSNYIRSLDYYEELMYKYVDLYVIKSMSFYWHFRILCDFIKSDKNSYFDPCNVHLYSLKNSTTKFANAHALNKIIFCAVIYIAGFEKEGLTSVDQNIIILSTLLIYISDFYSIHHLVPNQRLTKSIYTEKIIELLLKSYEYKDEVIETVNNVHINVKNDLVCRIKNAYEYAKKVNKKEQFIIKPNTEYAVDFDLLDKLSSINS